MKTLVLDFLRRWGWMLGLMLLLTVLIGLTSQTFILAPAALIGLLFDAQRGVLRAVRPLPIPRRAQARAWWFIGVPLIPLLSLPALVLGALVYQATHSAAAVSAAVSPGAQVFQMLTAPTTGASLWFGMAVQSWVAFGYAGFCFLLVLWLPTRPAEDVLEMIAQGVVGALWGLSIPSLIFILPNLPKSPAAIAPWHLAVFAAAPICFVLSFFAAPAMAQRRMLVVAAKTKPRPDSAPAPQEAGLRGVALFVVTFVVRFVGVIICIAIGQNVILRLILGGHSPADHAMDIQLVSIAIAFSIFTGEAIGMRTLRALPLSTVRLALLLSLLPWLAGLTAAAYTALWSGAGDPALPPLLNFAGQAAAFAGLGALAQTITLHITTGARLLVIFGLAVVPAAMFAMFPTHTAIFAIIGLVAGAPAFVLLMRGLRKSNAFYQPRRIFGMAVGQSIAVR